MTVDSKAMEIKKTQAQVAPVTQSAPAANKTSFIDFLSDIKSEFAKITWTSREELQTYTTIVVVATFLMGLCVFFVDVLIQSVLAVFDSIVRILVG